VLEVRRSVRGPQIFVSRTHKGFLRRLFELEVPEIHSGTSRSRRSPERRAAARRWPVTSRRTGSTRSVRPSVSAVRASRRSSRSSPARRSTSSRGTTTRPSSWPTP
jgi:N utilization substance protein A